MNDIFIIQGDTYEADLTIIGLESIDVVEKCVFSCKYLCVCKELQKGESTFKLYLSPQETAALTVGKSDYDITLFFMDDNVATVIYGGNIQVFPKKNKCDEP